MGLMLLGMTFAGGGSEDPWDDLLGARQLDEETLVATVPAEATLLALELLYRVKADVEVVALDVVDIELRQLLE